MADTLFSCFVPFLIFLVLFIAAFRFIRRLIESLNFLNVSTLKASGVGKSSCLVYFIKFIFKLNLFCSFRPDLRVMLSSGCRVSVFSAFLSNRDLAVFIILPFIGIMPNFLIRESPLVVLGSCITCLISLFSMVWSCCSSGVMKIHMSIIGRMYVM